MRAHLTTRRLASATMMLFHLLVLGLVPFADASAESRVLRDGAPHVEAEQKVPCSPGHDHLVCQLCRVIGSQPLAAGTAHVAGRPDAEGGRAAPVPATAPSGAGTLMALGPRAPPLR